MNILGISETRWPEDNDFWSDEFRVINSSNANGQGEVAIILDQTASRTIDRICFEGDGQKMVKLKSQTSRCGHHASVYDSRLKMRK